jgi:redox-sensitive bicupin YhaK (pirin superfamily)
VEHKLDPGRYAWVQAARGSVLVNGQELKAGDGAAVANEPTLMLTAGKDGGEALLFDLS